LVQWGTFNVTALSRQDSTATFAPGVTVKKGDYQSSEFLESALQGQDVLIITLAVTTSPQVQTDFIKAAAKAGVPWILPNEYGQDGANAELSTAVPLLGGKVKYRNQIEELGQSSWIGVASNLWFDFVRTATFASTVPYHRSARANPSHHSHRA
jgi:NmrA-like family